MAISSLLFLSFLSCCCCCVLLFSTVLTTTNAQIVGPTANAVVGPPTSVTFDITPTQPVVEGQPVTLLCAFGPNQQKRSRSSSSSDPSASPLIGGAPSSSSSSYYAPLDYQVNIEFIPKHRRAFAYSLYTTSIYVDVASNRAEKSPLNDVADARAEGLPWSTIQSDADMRLLEWRITFMAEARQEGAYRCKLSDLVGLSTESTAMNLTVLAPLVASKVATFVVAGNGNVEALQKTQTIGPDPRKFFREDTPASAGVTQRELSVQFRCAVNGVKPKPKLQFVLLGGAAAPESGGRAGGEMVKLDEFVMAAAGGSAKFVYTVENADGTWNVSSMIAREVKRQDNNKQLGCVAYSKSSPHVHEYDVKVERLHRLKIPLEPHVEMRLVVLAGNETTASGGGGVSLDKGLEENGTYTFECRASNALPEADVKWQLFSSSNQDISRFLDQRNVVHQRQPNRDDASTFDTISVVTLRNTSRFVHNARLICRAENVATRTLRINPPGFIQNVMVLHVNFPPNEPQLRAYVVRRSGGTSSAVALVAPPPNVQPSDVGYLYVDAGAAVRLQCDASANPDATYSWLHDGEPMPPANIGPGDQQQHAYMDDGNEQQLDLLDVQYDDAGQYTCIARNSYGSRQAHVQLVVRHKPVCQRCALNPVQLDPAHHIKRRSNSTDSSEAAVGHDDDAVVTQPQQQQQPLGCPVGVDIAEQLQHQQLQTGGGETTLTSTAASTTTTATIRDVLNCGSAVLAEPAPSERDFLWYYLPDIDVRNATIEQVMFAYEQVRRMNRTLFVGPQYDAAANLANSVDNNNNVGGGSGMPNGYGMYLCLPKNAIGYADMPCAFSVVPAARPRPPDSCSMTRIAEKEVKIRCQPGWDGGSNQKFRIVVASLPGGDVGKFTKIQQNLVANDEWTIADLPQAGSDYTLTIYAVNRLGESEPLPMAIRTAGISPTQSRVKYTIAIIVGIAALVVMLVACVLATILCKRNGLNTRRTDSGGGGGTGSVRATNGNNGHFTDHSSDNTSHPTQTASSGRSSVESPTTNNNNNMRNGKPTNGHVNGANSKSGSGNYLHDVSLAAEHRLDNSKHVVAVTSIAPPTTSLTTTTSAMPAYHYVSGSNGENSIKSASGISLHINGGMEQQQKLGALKLVRGQKQQQYALQQQQQQQQKVKAPTAPAHYTTNGGEAIHYRAASSDLNGHKSSSAASSALSGSASSVPSSVASAAGGVVVVNESVAVARRTPSAASSSVAAVAQRPSTQNDVVVVTNTTTVMASPPSTEMNVVFGGQHSRDNSTNNSDDNNSMETELANNNNMPVQQQQNVVAHRSAAMMINSPKPMMKPFINGKYNNMVATNATSIMNCAQHHMQQNNNNNKHHLPQSAAAMVVTASNAANNNNHHHHHHRTRASGDVVAVV